MAEMETTSDGGRGAATNWSKPDGTSLIMLRDEDSTDGGTTLVWPDSPQMPGPVDRAGRLHLLGEIARGGMGAILKGRDVDLGRDLAVKVLLERHREKPDLIRRFVEEAQIAGQLQHPGVVPVYELGAFADRRPYFAMKLVKGRTLAKILAERESPASDRSRLLAVFLQVAQTVAYAHSRGVIHRDLKPSNVMVGSFGEVQVMDWGLAKVLPRGGASDDANAGRVDDHETVIATARSDGEADSELSVAGSVMGTPAYMAPEQARGEVDRLDERCDVFALGSILCEILTGQPAFVGRNAGEIQRKAARGDASEALALLKSDATEEELATIARDCLAPEPDDRPADAGILAERLSAYLAGVQDRLRLAELATAAESARAEEAKRTAEAAEARVRAERRARRLTAALAASVLGLASLGGGGAALLRARQASRTASTTRAVDAALDRVAHLRGEAKAAPVGDLDRWREADAALKGADDLVQQGEADSATARRVAAARSQFDREFGEAKSKAAKVEVDRKLLARLEEIRGDSEKFNPNSKALARYAEAFREAGLDLARVQPAAAGAWIAGRSAPIELVAYLDDWANLRHAYRTRPGDESWLRLIATARAADPDPWRNALRDQLGRKGAEANVDALRRLADDEPALARQPAASLILLAAYLKGAANDRERAGRVLRLAWRINPGDYWTNTELAMFESGKVGAKVADTAEAIRYLAVAVALHPTSADARNHLGIALKQAGRHREAEAEYREAIRLAPKAALAHNNLGNTLTDQGRFAEAEVEYREALRIDPKSPITHMNLGILLARPGGQPEKVEAEYREAIRLLPGYADAHEALGNLLRSRKDFAGAEAEVREAVRLGPEVARFRYNLGVALNRLGRVAEAEAEAREAVRLAPDDSEYRTTLGSILISLRRPAEAEAEFREAIRRHPELARPHALLIELLKSQGRQAELLDEIRAEVRRNPNDPLAHKNLGNLYYEQRKYDQAEAEYREALRLKPDFPNAHHNMGNILLAKGDGPGALAAYKRAAELYGPGSRQGQNEIQYIRKATLANRLPAVLRGDEKPDAAGLREFAEVAEDMRLYASSLRLYGQAFAADPKIAANRNGQYPYLAACRALQAATNEGRDDPPPDADGRVALRRRALDFLKSELNAWRSHLAAHPETAVGVAATLEGWRIDDDLASIREAVELAKLPEAERKEWEALWADHAALIAELRQPKADKKP